MNFSRRAESEIDESIIADCLRCEVIRFFGIPGEGCRDSRVSVELLLYYSFG